MKKINLIGIILAIILMASSVIAAPYRVDENMEFGENDAYNLTNVNSTNLYQDGSKVLDADDINGTTFNYTKYANESLYWDDETSQSDLNVNSSNYWDELGTPADIAISDLDQTGEEDLNVNYSTTAGTVITWDGETSQADLNVNSSNWWAALTGWSSTMFENVANELGIKMSWFNNSVDARITVAEPDLNVNSSKYWDDAETWANLTNLNPSQTRIVCKVGCNYSTIQGAIDSITDATASKRYVVQIYPGQYAETIVGINYTDLMGVESRESVEITGVTGPLYTFPDHEGNIYNLHFTLTPTSTGQSIIYIPSTASKTTRQVVYHNYFKSTASTDIETTIFDVDGGKTRFGENKVLMTNTYASAGTLNTQRVWQVSGDADIAITDCTTTVQMYDEDDKVYLYEDTSLTGGEANIKNNIFHAKSFKTGVFDGLYIFIQYTGTDATLNSENNHIHLVSVAGSGSSYGRAYRLVSGGTGVIDSVGNHILVEGFSENYWATVSGVDTIFSHFDHIHAENGSSGAGIVKYVNSPSDGNLEVSNTTTSELFVGPLTGTASNATTWDDEISQSNLNVNSSNYWDYLGSPSDITGLNTTNIASLNGSKINNMDLSCGADTYLTVINFSDESGTCTGISDVYMSNSGDTGAGDYLFTGAVTINSTEGITLNVSDTLFVNGSSGNVGIGTTNPTAGLFIQQDDALVGLYINQTGAHIPLYIENTGGQNSMYVKSLFGFNLIQTAADGTGMVVTRNNDAAETYPLVQFTANHVSDTQPALKIQQDGTGNGILIDKNGNGTSISIDSESLEGAVISISKEDSNVNAGFLSADESFTISTQLTRGINDGLATNYFLRNLASANTDSPLVFIEQDNAGDDQPALTIQQDGAKEAMKITQNGDTSYALYIENNGVGEGLRIYNSEATASSGIYYRDVTGLTKVTLGAMNTAGTGNNWFYRGLNSTYTAGSIVFIEQDDADDDQPALKIQQDSTAVGLISLVQNSHTCNLIVDADGTCDAGTKIGEDNSIALCMVCS